MAMVGSGRSTLNPDAPLFIPAAYRRVEDFSPEWWHLITTSSPFRDYWLAYRNFDDNYNHEEEGHDFDADDVADLLPETFDLDPALDDYFSNFVDDDDDNNNNNNPAHVMISKESTIPGAQTADD
ncbi:hypothetical protein Tsubulata_015106 [Turnera subulata]|uniref:Ataxin-2 C-terminal domain-containing protein n=1 Tax=Turnera subulata TaxID=218843 RepID=A0A9Q0G8P7_9ROSI|nr:hypothetical protein Tsubulata_015106 [Turnera subulata]